MLLIRLAGKCCFRLLMIKNSVLGRSFFIGFYFCMPGVVIFFENSYKKKGW